MFVATVYSLFILDKMEIFIKFFPSHFLWMSRSVAFQDNNQLLLSTRTSHHNLLARSTIFKHWMHESPQLGPRRDYGWGPSKLKWWVLKKSCPVVHIHPTTPFSSCLWASKISKYRMANSNRGYVKLPNFKESSPTPAIPAPHQSSTTTPKIRNHHKQISPINLLPYRKLKTEDTSLGIDYVAFNPWGSCRAG